MSANPDYITIKDYLAGKLDSQVAHELEKRALEDPFLADAIEGYRSAHVPSDHQLSILQRQLEERIAVQQENKNKFNFTTQRLSIAAAAGLLFITAGLLFWMKMPHPFEQPAQSKKVDVELTPENIKPESQAQAADNISKSKPDPAPPQVAAAARPAGVKASSAAGMGTASATGNPEEKNAHVVSMTAMSKAIAPSFTGGTVTTFRGNPLPGAAVGVKGSAEAIFTDDSGRFILPANTKGTIVLAAVGYQTVELNINPGDKLMVTLNEEPNSLNEVVVTATGVDGKRRGVLPDAIQPKGGREQFDQYAAGNVRYPAGTEKIAGEVALAFSVDSRGKPENIRVVKSLNTALDNEAIRVLKEGPSWELNGVNGSSEAQVSIKFKP